jgi:CRP-like cAMP-binding protein
MADTTTPTRLDGLGFVEGLGPEDLDRLAEMAAPALWAAGEVIFREGQRDGRIYVVDEGRVALEVTQPGRGRMTILTVGPGEVFGWSSLFQERPKTASARALQPTRGVSLDAARLRVLCDADPRLGYLLTRRILSAVAERLQSARLQLLDVFAGPASSDRGAS